MYLPTHFREDRLEVQHALIRAHPLGLLVSHDAADGLVADPVPFVLDAEHSPLGTLKCHVARANPHWRRLQTVAECLVVFQGPQAYVTPSWYPTKHETGRVVPTWNYVIVQCRGRPRVIDDAVWTRAQVDVMTNAHEANRDQPWQVDDAPAAFVEAQLKGIVGVEIAISRIEGKWKMSQNRSEADWDGVHNGLVADGSTDAAAVVAGCGRFDSR